MSTSHSLGSVLLFWNLRVLLNGSNQWFLAVVKQSSRPSSADCFLAHTRGQWPILLFSRTLSIWALEPLSSSLIPGTPPSPSRPNFHLAIPPGRSALDLLPSYFTPDVYPASPWCSFLTSRRLDINQKKRSERKRNPGSSIHLICTLGLEHHPAHIRMNTSLGWFRRELKVHLFNELFIHHQERASSFYWPPGILRETTLLLAFPNTGHGFRLSLDLLMYCTLMSNT